MEEKDFQLSSYQYELPEERIAQISAEPRDAAKMLVFKRENRVVAHKQVKDISDQLREGDVLVLNDTRVFKARTHAISETGRAHEVLLIPKGEGGWSAICSQTRKLKEGMKLFFIDQPVELKEEGLSEKEALAYMEQNRILAQGAVLEAKVMYIDREEGDIEIIFNQEDHEIFAYTDENGEVPLPPYIENRETDLTTYQTTFAENVGSVAAPTAGRHFTSRLLQELQSKGVQIEYITLHVGIGTFLPVWAEDIREHKMHAEWVSISEEVGKRIAQARKNNRRVIAVGTTVARALEGACKQKGDLQKGFKGHTDIFISPGFEFKIINGLLTNFHLPGTSLLMLVSALIGREQLLELYEEAKEEEYRFYSLGDAMLIL